MRETAKLAEEVLDSLDMILQGDLDEAKLDHESIVPPGLLMGTS